MSLEDVAPPPVDLPSLTLRWEGLVVVLDATTLNTVLRRATRRIPEIRSTLIEPENGRLGITLKVKKGVPVTLRAHLASLRFKDGFLGFRIEDLTAYGFVPIPDWVIRRIVDHQPPGRAFYYPDGRVVVIHLGSLLPPELSIQIREVVCEHGEMRFIFGPSQYRLDRLVDELGRDPFSDD